MSLRGAWFMALVSVTGVACGGGDDGGAEPGGAEPRSNSRPSFDASCDELGVICHDFGPIDVAPGEEYQGFQIYEVGNLEDRAIVQMEVDQLGALSHHYIVSLWKGDGVPPLGGPYDLFSSEGLAVVGDTLGAIVAGSVFKYVYIDTGKYVGMEVPTGAYFIHNAHYLNATNETVTGHSRVKIKTVAAEDVRFLAVEAQPGNSEINVPPREERTIGRTWVPETDVAILLMTSHMHRHGTLFEAWATVDGVEQKVYSTEQYDGPPLEILAADGKPPLVLRPQRGDQIRFECTHKNFDLDEPLVFGPTADKHEMCIFPFVYIDEPDAFLALYEEGGTDGYNWYYEGNGD